MTDECGAFTELRDVVSFEKRTLVDFLKASAIVATAVVFALVMPNPDARTTDDNPEPSIFPFGSALSLRSALPPGPTLSGESATFSIVEAPPAVEPPAPPIRTPITRHFRPRNRVEPVAETRAIAKVGKERRRRALRREENPLTVIARAADALAMEIGRGFQQLPVRLSQLFSGRRRTRVH